VAIRIRWYSIRVATQKCWRTPLEVKVGSELEERFVISELLGDGGFGIVWRATRCRKGLRLPAALAETAKRGLF
jgi:hypothetical protein